jgi:hypothetical protein
MLKRKTFVNRATAGAAVCALIAACSSSNNSTNSSDASASGSYLGNPTPPGTTPVTQAPYPVGDALQPGSFVTANDAGATYPTPAAFSASPPCSNPGGPVPTSATNPPDAHCTMELDSSCNTPPQPVNGADCDNSGADASEPAGDAAAPACPATSGMAAQEPPDAGLPCDEDGIDGAYGYTHYGTEGDDDDCKYHVTYQVSPICENNGTYFIVNAVYQAGSTSGLIPPGAPLTGASTYAEICANDGHPAPNLDNRPTAGNQQVVEGPPGTYTIGPVEFDKAGMWTVRFHFNEFCLDGVADSPHGHAAFFLNVN